jgi:nitroreductase
MPDIGLEPYVEALGEFPITGTPSQKLEAAVQYAVRAPSSHNSQPWLFRIAGDTLELRADRSRALPVVDPNDRELIISCGAALFHVGVVLRHYGSMPRIERLPDATDPDLLARVHLGEPREHTAEDEALFHAIPARRTFRNRFADRCLPEGLGSMLEVAARAEGAWLQVFRTKEARHAVADLVGEADRLLMSDKRVRRELALWLRPNRGKRRDGMPGYALGLGAVKAAVGPMVVRMFDAGRGQAARDRRLVADAPMLALLGTARDTPYHWLVAGEAVAHVLLRAQVSDIAASFLNQPIEVPDLRTRLQTLAGRDGYPQLLLRLGYGHALRATPRRPVAEVVEA